MAGYYLDFERPAADLDRRIDELKRRAEGSSDESTLREIAELEEKARTLRKKIFAGLSPWQRCQTARHPDRPYTLDYIRMGFEDFVELHGDRRYGDDPAVVAGFARLDGRPVAVVGHQKGRDTRDRIRRNFGQPHPEGYRKALRIIKLAERMGLPVVTLIDTPGAYPGIGAEQRGQGEAIALNLEELARIKVPVVSVVIGEGGSGGALALGVGDRVSMLENAVYSVISPEGCAAILWKKGTAELSQADFERAADALRLTAKDLLALGVVDHIIPEPPGGAHRDPEAMAGILKEHLVEGFAELAPLSTEALIRRRYERLRKIGEVNEPPRGDQGDSKAKSGGDG